MGIEPLVVQWVRAPWQLLPRATLRVLARRSARCGLTKQLNLAAAGHVRVVRPHHLRQELAHVLPGARGSTPTGMLLGRACGLSCIPSSHAAPPVRHPRRSAGSSTSTRQASCLRERAHLLQHMPPTTARLRAFRPSRSLLQYTIAMWAWNKGVRKLEFWNGAPRSPLRAPRPPYSPRCLCLRSL